MLPSVPEVQDWEERLHPWQPQEAARGERRHVVRGCGRLGVVLLAERQQPQQDPHALDSPGLNPLSWQTTATTLFGIGGLTANEGRKMFGMEPLEQEGMDTPYAPIQMTPIGAESVAPNVPA